MTQATEQRFAVDPIERTRRRAQPLHEQFVGREPGWTINRDAAVQVLSMFSRLILRDAHSMLTAAHTDGANGSGWTWAFALDAPVPAGWPAFDDRSWEPTTPPNALPHFMEAVDGDGSLRSYLQASIYCREVEELGALWHGVEWGTHVIVGADEASDPIDMWTWEQARPAKWAPHAYRHHDGVTVRFITQSDLGQSRLIERVDRYEGLSLLPKSERTTLASGPGGFVF